MDLSEIKIEPSKGKLSELCQVSSIEDFKQLSNFLRKLPYGRNTNRSDLSLVIKDKIGTCSSKHALIKAVAIENEFDELKLIMGLYKMTPKNTPGVGDFIKLSGLEYIPEAHCYIRRGKKTIDLTSRDSNFDRIEKDLLIEIEIEPEQVVQFKIDYHKEFIRNWIKTEKIDLTFDEIWHLREDCISNLSKQ